MSFGGALWKIILNSLHGHLNSSLEPFCSSSLASSSTPLHQHSNPTIAGNMDPVQDILDAEYYIKDNIVEACKELHNNDKPKPNGVIETARAKIHWLNERSLVIEQFIYNEALRIVAESK